MIMEILVGLCMILLAIPVWMLFCVVLAPAIKTERIISGARKTAKDKELALEHTKKAFNIADKLISNGYLNPTSGDR